MAQSPSQCWLVAVALLVPIPATPLWSQTLETQLQPIATAIAAGCQAAGARRIAVADLTDLQGQVTELGRFLAEELEVSLLGTTPKIDIIDRSNLGRILAERKLSVTGIVNPATAKQLGQIAGVDGIVTGTITPLGDTFRLTIKVVATDTATVIAAARSDIARTPAIDAVSGRGLGDGAGVPRTARPVLPSEAAAPEGGAGTHAREKPPAAVGSGRVGPIAFSISGCEKAGTFATCRGLITNKGPKTLYFESGGGTAIVDELGNKASNPKMSVGSGRATESLEPDVAVKFELTGQNIAAQAERVTVIVDVPGYVLGLGYGGWNNQRLSIRNLPLSERE
jgi:TolB-like protein